MLDCCPCCGSSKLIMFVKCEFSIVVCQECNYEIIRLSNHDISAIINMANNIPKIVNKCQ